MKNKTLARVRVGISAWIKIYIRQTENTELLRFFLQFHSYVSRKNFMDSTKHCILGTQQFRPRELASQMNLSMDNGWGIIRCIVDYCMSLSDGKYLILKDPNKASGNLL